MGSRSTFRRKVKIVKVASWKEARKRLLVLAPTHNFRGQNDARMPLRSTLERLLVDRDETEVGREVEDDLLDYFRRRAGALLPASVAPRLEDTHAWLGLMQHYGGPTRFLDLTRSPFVAAYFALQRALPPRHFHAVWAFEEKPSADFAVAAIAKWKAESAEIARWRLESQQDPMVAELANPKGELPATPFAFVTEPWTFDARQSVQQALFLCPSHVDLGMETHLTKVASSITLIKIPASARDDALWELRQMNVTEASLFPGLEGLARSLNTLRVGKR